ncbi:MAG TPA: hypothetical protein VKS01_13075 [Bryobacteraceae bacterium]|nr:hypothetical protein [Bryobacteraceae bacterium]
MAYKIFERVSARVVVPALTIAPQGRVVFNAAACRLLIESGVKHVIVLWDSEARKIGVKSGSKDDKNAFSVTFTGGHSASFGAKSFFQHIGWSAPKRQLLETTWNPKTKMFEATLPAQFLSAKAAR